MISKKLNHFFRDGISFSKLLFIRKTVILFLIHIIIYSCATTTVERQKEADLYLTLGLSYLNENNYQMAYIQFQRAYAIEPKNRDVLNGLGIVYLYFDDLVKAEKFFKEALEVDKNFSEAHNSLGLVYARLSRWSEAIEHFKRALANPLYQNPENAYFNLGSTYYRMGKYDQSVIAYRDSLRRSPNFLPSLYGLALSYNRLGRYGDAAEVLSQAIALDPRYNGDKMKFIEDIRANYLKSGSEDLADYLDIVNY